MKKKVQRYQNMQEYQMNFNQSPKKQIPKDQQKGQAQQNHDYQQKPYKKILDVNSVLQNQKQNPSQIQSQIEHSCQTLNSFSRSLHQQPQQKQQSSGNDLDTKYLMDKILDEKKMVEQASEDKVSNVDNQSNNKKDKQRQWRKRLEIRMDDIKLYNSKWISRLCQMYRNSVLKQCSIQQSSQFRQEQNQQQKCKEQNILYMEISFKFPEWLQKLLIKNYQNISGQQTQFYYQTLFLPQNLSKAKDLRLEQICLVILYHYQNIQLQKFLLQPLNQPNFHISTYSTNHFLNSQQFNIISKNFRQFSSYIHSKSINDLFQVRVLSFKQIFCHQNQFCHHNNDSKNPIKYQPTLLQKIISIRKIIKLIQQKTNTNKSISIKQSSLKLSQTFYKTNKKYEKPYLNRQLYGNKQLIDELWNLYSHQTKSNINNTSIQMSKLNVTNLSKDHIKFVQFVPKLDINQNNYNKFLTQVSQIKKVYFNGMSVGFQGFRISNFTTRSQNNITFVFHDFHQLVQLQSLLIDFQFPLNYIEQIKKQYVQFPNKKLKKIKIKFHVAQKSKKSNQSMRNYPESYNQKLDTTKSPYPAFLKNTSFLPINQKNLNVSSNRLMNSTMINSSFFLEPSGYYEKIQEKSMMKEYLKEFYFYKLDMESPDYERLIKHINSLSSVSKTLIMKFECIFPLIRFRDSLNQLINICSDFCPTELHILPQPLQLVKIHEDYRSNLVTLKDQVRELLQNEEKFGCLNISRSGLKSPMQKLNSINSFNMVKVHEEYLMKRQLFRKIHKEFSQYSNRDRPIYNNQFEQIANSIQFLLPNSKLKNQFICFPFHNRTFKIVKYFEPGTMNLLNLQLIQTNQRSQNFLPVQEITLNQYKTKMIKQGLDFFYYSYPFGQKYKLSLHNYNIYSLTLKNQLKFNKLDHLRVLYWLGKLNRVENKIVFYQNSLSKPYLSEQNKKKYFAQTFIKEKLPSFDYVYDIGFVDDYLKTKIVQIQVYSPVQVIQKNKKQNLIFKKAIDKINLEGSNSNKTQRLQSYKIKTNRATWDLVLKKLKQICDEKQNQLRKLTVSEQDDKQFQRLKNSLKKTN